MANGLRKLIRNARKLTTPSPLTRRINRFGQRLNVEELEERIAPATVSLEPGEFSIYDLDANNTPGVGDGWIGLSDATTAGVTASFEATETGAVDTIDTSITINLGAVVGACTVHLATNRDFEDITIIGGANVTILTLAIETGYDTSYVDVTDTMVIDSSDGAVTGDLTTLNTDELTGDPDTGGNLAFTNVAAANAEMGTITFPSHAGLLVQFHIQAGLTGDLAAFGGITSADADVDFRGDETNGAASTISADSINAISIAGEVAPSAESITIATDAAVGNIQIATLAPSGAGSFTLTAGTTIGDITIGTVAPSAAGGVTFTATGGDVGDLEFTAINLTGAGGFTINAGDSVGDIDVTEDISTTSTGDVLIDATGASGEMGNVTVGGSVTAGNAGSTITIQASDGMGDITVTGSIGGTAGTVTFDGNDDGSDDGDIGNIDVGVNIGNGGATVAFTAVNIGTIDAQKIGLGAGGVTFTADDPDDDDGGTANGTIGALGTGTTIVSIGEGGAVVFNADDGIGGGTAITVAGSIANGGNVTFSANRDDNDDTGSVPAITAGTNIGTPGGFSLIIDTMDNDGTDDDNTVARTVGAITANNGFARIIIDSDGDIGLITVTGDSGAGNDLELDIDTNDGVTDKTNVVNFAGINVPDTANSDSVTIIALSEITGRIWNAGANGQIIAGGGDATDVLDLDANLVIYNGDDAADGAIDADYSATNAFQVMFTTGNVTGAGTIIAAVRTASPLFTAVIDGETFTVDATNNDASAVTMTATLTFDPNAGTDGDDLITIDDIDGTGIGATTELSVTSSEGTEFDVGGITLATGGEGTHMALITIEGDLDGNIGEVGEQFGDVEVILIAGNAGGNTFYGTGLNGLGTGGGTLNLGANVDIGTLDRDVDEPLVIPGELTFNFADVAGAAAGSFNHHITVVGAGSSVTVYGIDGAGNGDGGVTTAYEFSGTGNSGQQIDPSGLMAALPDALISRISLDGITGLSTDVAVREVEGTTSGSWLEFETNVGLVELTTQLDSISVGIDDNDDAIDNVVITGVNQQANTRANFDRLGGGEGGSAKRGLEPDTSVSDDDAIMGNFIAASMGDPGDPNINIVVTGNCGPITLTGDFTLEVSDIGSLNADNGAGAAAIAIGGNQVGAITIPGAVDGDILIGIGLDANGDGDLEDDDDVAPGGSLSGAVTIGDMDGYDILVYNNITSSIVIEGYDNNPELPGLDADGDLRGVKAGGNLGDLGEDVVMVQGELNYVIADGALNSGIFSGGNNTDVVVIEGTTINGPGVIGGTAGVQSVTFNDYENFGDATGDSDTISVNAGGMTIRWVAGAFGNTVDTLGDVYVQGANATLTVANTTGDGLNIGNMFLLDDGEVDINSDNNVGVVIAADDVTVPSSETLQDLISTTVDVVYSPTALDDASGDDTAMLSYTGTIDAANAGGVVAEEDVDVTVDIAGTYGYTVALNGSVTGDVHAGVAIGSIVASTNIINSEFRSEGTLALGDAATMSTAITTTWGLAGLPAWFASTGGGVVSEAGSIVNSDFIANGGMVLVQGTGFVAASSMGTFYVLAGDIDDDSSIICGGSMGGLQVPTGVANMLFRVSMDGNIDRIVVADWSPVTSAVDPELNSVWNTGRVTLFVDASAGDLIVVEANPFTSDEMNVAVTGASTLVVLRSTGAYAIGDIDGAYDVEIVGGLVDGASVVIDGPADDIAILGDWAGLIDIGYHAIAGLQGSCGTIIVDGEITDTAELIAFNFENIQVDEDEIDPAVMSEFTLDRSNPIETFTGLSGNTVTLALDGVGVAADVTTLFGKPVQIEITGYGVASLYSLEGDLTISEVRSVGIDVMLGRAGLEPADEASAHVGTVSVLNNSRALLRNVVVEGASESLNAGNSMVMNLFNAGDAGTVRANMLLKAFIGGNVETSMTARLMMNTHVMGNAELMGAWLFNNVVVDGVTSTLFNTGGFDGGFAYGNLHGTANGFIINSSFAYVNDNNFDYDWDEDGTDDYINPVRIINSYIGMPDEDDEA